MISRYAVVASIVLILTSTIGIGMAQSSPAWSEDLYAEMEVLADGYNEHADEIDFSYFEGELKNRNVNLYVDGPGGEAVYSFRMDADHRIVNLREEKNPDASLRMSTSKATVEAIAEAENPAKAFRDAVADGDVVIDGEDGELVEKIKWFILNGLRGLLM